MNSQLELHLLGKPQFRYGGSDLTAELISAKGQALLSYLAVTRQNHARSALAGLLWGDLPEENARANLRLTLTRLRKALGADCLAVTRLEIGLDNFWLDLHQLQQNAFADLEQLCHLYRGDFLDGFDLPHAPEFETWLLGIRQQARQTAVSALYQQVETAVQEQQAEPGLRAARKLLSIEPWHEESHRHLMHLLAASGQRSAALAQFESCRRLLADELGIEPAAATVALHQQILRDQITKWPDPGATSAIDLATPTSAYNLPPQFTPFIGRSDELENLCRRLQDGRYRLVTLLGEGGVGKTRLALAAAARLLPYFADGVWFVPLEALAADDEQTALDMEDKIAAAVAVSLGLNFSTDEPPKQQLVHYLRRRHTLLILDNFEPLLAAAGLTLTLLAHAPQVTILATSRQPLQLQAELIVRVEGLALPEADDWQTAATADSVRLFAERAERASGQNLLTEENLAAIVSLCHFVNGLPLGLELIADWTRWLSLNTIAAELQSNLLQLETPARDVPARHRSLQAVFDYSWQMLSTVERQTLAQLSIFRGGFQLDAVTKIIGGEPATLFSLIDKSLVQHKSADRYSLHELLRLFARSQLDALALDVTALRDRHAVYYLEWLSRHTAPSFAGPNPLSALRAAQAEAENLSRAWQWASQRPLPELLLVAVTGMSAYWYYAGLFQQAEAALAEAIGQAKALVAEPAVPARYSRLLAALNAEQAMMLHELSRPEEMKRAAEAAVYWSQQAGDEEWEANGRLRLGQYHWRRGSYDEAEAELSRAAHLAQKLGLTSLEGMIYRSLAVTAWRQGELAQAQQHGERSLALYRQVNDVRGQLRSQYFLAILAQNRQQHATARAYLEPMLTTAQALADRPLEMSAVALLGQICAYKGQFEQALAYLRRERQLAEESGQQWQLANNLSNTGDLWLRLGQFKQADACYHQVLALLRQLGSGQGQSNVLSHMGLLAFMQGDYEKGRAYCQEALALAQAENVRREQAFAHIFLAHNLSGLQQWAGAREAYELAIAAWGQLEDKPRQMEAQAGLARTLLAIGQVDEAVTAVAPVLAYLDSEMLVGANDPVLVYLTLYQVLTAVGDARAPDYLRTGQALLAELTEHLTDPDLRRALRENIPAHRAIMHHPSLL
jgi:predicted ATPase/DNA-binding SARP family transcriptional activator/tetratricopeptide (TPR) repeat protein